MLLRVGPFSYRVEKVPGYLEHEGEACLGLCDNEAQVLWVSERCSPAQQVQVICHEYMEAWVYHFGQGVADKEGWCDLFGVAMTQLVQDLPAGLRLGDTQPPGRGFTGALSRGEMLPVSDQVWEYEEPVGMTGAGPVSQRWRVRVFEAEACGV